MYAFITLALLGLSAGLDSFFSSELSPQSESLQRLLSAASTQRLNVQKLLIDSEIPFQQRALDDLAWSASQRQTLLAGQPISLFDSSSAEQIYLPLDEHQLLEVSLPPTDNNRQTMLLYRSTFFILLGALIALWIWPLWRDLETLKKSVSTVMPDGNIVKNSVSPSSLVAPIARALNAMSEQIAHLIQSQRELSGAVAHEFRTPLARLKFALGMQEKTQNPLLKEMRCDVVELEKLVQEMLNYSTIEAQLPEMHFSEIALSTLCRNLIDKLSISQLNGLNIKVSGSAQTLLGDGHYIERAIENVILNACRFASTQILLTIEQSGDSINLHIEDDGKGVAAHLRQKVFEPFFRPDAGRDRRQGGAGLGLAIVRRVMQWHFGYCDIADSRWGGAKVSLYFPLNRH